MPGKNKLKKRERKSKSLMKKLRATELLEKFSLLHLRLRRLLEKSGLGKICKNSTCPLTLQSTFPTKTK